MIYRVTFLENAVSPEHVKTFDLLAGGGLIRDKVPCAMDLYPSGSDDATGIRTWDYDIAEERQGEFIDTVIFSDMVMECVPLETLHQVAAA